MNVVALVGRTTKEVEVRYTQGEKPTAFARFTLAVNRMEKDKADFISCVAFGKTAEYIGKYSTKGCNMAVTGRIQTGSYQKGSEKVYTTDVIVDRAAVLTRSEAVSDKPSEAVSEGFVQATMLDEGLPWG